MERKGSDKSVGEGVRGSFGVGFGTAGDKARNESW